MGLFPLGLIGQGSGGAAGVPAFEQISTQILASNATSVTFTSIPATYKHLQIRFTARFADAYTSSNFSIRLNSDSAANYASHRLTSQSGAISADNLTATATPYLGFIPGASTTANTFAAGVIDLFDYADTNKTKVMRAFIGSESSSRMSIGSSLWTNTSAVTTLQLRDAGGLNLVTGSRFTLYGIKG